MKEFTPIHDLDDITPEYLEAVRRASQLSIKRFLNSSLEAIERLKGSSIEESE